MMKVLLLTVTSIILSMSPAYAALFICGDASTFFGHMHADRSQPPTCPLNLHRIDDSTLADQQLTFIDSQPKKYLKVVGGIVVEKTSEEKTAVDQAIAAQTAITTALETEKTANSLCNERDPAIINQRMNTFTTNLLADTEVQSRNRIAGAFRQLVLCLAARGR